MINFQLLRLQRHLLSKWKNSRIRLQKEKYCVLFPCSYSYRGWTPAIRHIIRFGEKIIIIGTSRLYSGQFRSSIYIFLVTKRINKKRLFSKSGQEWTKFLLQGQWKIVLHHLLYIVLVLHTNTYLCLYLSLFSKYR